MDVKKIKVYDLDAFLRKELELESFRYEKAAIFEGPYGVVLAEHEAVHKRVNAVTDTVQLEANKIAEPGTMWIAPSYVVSATIDELKTAPYEEMTMEEFFDRRNYNPRCENNYMYLMESLRGIGFDLHGYFPTEQVKPLADRIQAAEAQRNHAPQPSAPQRDAVHEL